MPRLDLGSYPKTGSSGCRRRYKPITRMATNLRGGNNTRTCLNERNDDMPWSKFYGPLYDVSIIVPSNRGGASRDACMASIVAAMIASQKRCQLVVVVDGPNPEVTTPAYPGVRMVYMHRQAGPAACRNMGIRCTSGTIVMMTDDDCIVPRDWIVRLAEFLERHPEVAAVGGLLEAVTPTWVSHIEKWKERVLTGCRADREKIGRSGIPAGSTCNVAYRRTVLEEVGLFDETFTVPAGEDTELMGRIAAHYDVAATPVVVLHNQPYNVDYLLAAVYKQCLDRLPPKNKFTRRTLWLALLPRAIYTGIRKLLRYRRLWKGRV